MRVPQLVIAGAQKAGTTTLEGWLARHPDVWMPDVENAFFRDPVYDPRKFAEFVELYQGRGERLLGLKCPDYLARPEVPQRLAQHLTDPRILVSLRNPVKRAISAYYWNMRWGTLPVKPLNIGLRSILESDGRSGGPHAQEVLSWGLYATHIDRYLSTFADHECHVVLEDDLRTRPSDLWRDIAAFLDLDPAKVDIKSARSRNQGVYSIPRLRFLQIRKPIVLKTDPATGYATIAKSRSRTIRAFTNAVAGVDSFILEPLFDNSPPQLEPDVEESLLALYRPEIIRLQDILGRDLAHWLEP